jgi:hypothetical protein
MTSWTVVYSCRRFGGAYHTPKMEEKRDKMMVDKWTLLALNMGEIGNMYTRKFVCKYLKECIDEGGRIIIK